MTSKTGLEEEMWLPLALRHAWGSPRVSTRAFLKLLGYRDQTAR